MVWLAAKVRMRILALGNKLTALRLIKLKQSGFTLMELMVVVAIIAIASTGVMFAIPDAAATALERDAQRLAALLDSARAQSRASGLAVVWRATPYGFKFEGL
ncbi:MAG: type secretion system protein GspH, partial [Pseudomonadota bacterium]